jgi:preprotein translocase subunit SecF
MRFLANRKKFYIVSGVLTLLSLVSFFFLPKNYGIDMTGGLQISYSTENQVLPENLESAVNTNDIRMDIGLVAESDIETAQMQVTDIRNVLPSFFKKKDMVVSELSFVSVGNSFGKFVLDRAYLTLTMCLIAIAIYLMFAFRKSIE